MDALERVEAAWGDENDAKLQARFVEGMQSDGVFSAVSFMQAGGLMFRSLVDYRLAESNIEHVAKLCPINGGAESGLCVLTRIPLAQLRCVPISDVAGGKLL